MKFSKAVKHLRSLGLDVGHVAHKLAGVRLREPERRRVPVVVAKNGTMPKKLREMIRQSRAEARNSK
jgi:hypothetical protein